MAKWLWQHLSGAHRPSIFQDWSLWRHLGVWCGSYVRVPYPSWTTLAICLRFHPQWANQLL
jgi:hypothetical protein